MANCQKYSKAACGHLFKHYEREKDDKGDYVKFGNQEINPRLTHLNYNLAPERDITQGEFIKQRCSEVYCLNRKDVNVMCSWVVTAPKDLPSNENKQFFQAAYDFMANRYGQENVISSYVHLDESTPHMHFAFVPVTFDKKKNRLKVSAFEVITRQELKVFHQQLQDYVEQALGHKVAILNGATVDGNKSIQELKNETAAEAQKSLSKAKTYEDAYRDATKAVRIELGAISDVLNSEKLETQKEMYEDVQVVDVGFLKKEKMVQVPLPRWEAINRAVDREGRMNKALEHFENVLSNLSKNAKNYVDYWQGLVKNLELKIKNLEQEKKNIMTYWKDTEKELRLFKKWLKNEPDLSDRFEKFKAQTEKVNIAKNEKRIQKDFNIAKKRHDFER